MIGISMTDAIGWYAFTLAVLTGIISMFARLDPKIKAEPDFRQRLQFVWFIQIGFLIVTVLAWR